MPNRTLLSIILVLGLGHADAQNLIPNGSFENYTSCPTGTGQISQAPNWFPHTPNCTPDLYHACAFPGPMGVPTMGDTIYAYDGDGMARIYLYSSFGREFISTRLLDPLQAGQEYIFSIQIRLFSNDLIMCGSIGALVSQDSLTGFLATCEEINLVPQMARDSSLIMDQEGIWVNWTDTMLADGGEEWITIGNFRNNANTPMTGTTFGTALYLLDDISLVEIMTVGVEEPLVEFSIFPNPANDVVRFKVQGTRSVRHRLSIHNSVGQEVANHQLSTINHQLNTADWPLGVYIVRITDENGASSAQKLMLR